MFKLVIPKKLIFVFTNSLTLRFARVAGFLISSDILLSLIVVIPRNSPDFFSDIFPEKTLKSKVFDYLKYKFFKIILYQIVHNAIYKLILRSTNGQRLQV